jgi:hypothetical protein
MSASEEIWMFDLYVSVGFLAGPLRVLTNFEVVYYFHCVVFGIQLCNLEGIREVGGGYLVQLGSCSSFHLRSLLSLDLGGLSCSCRSGIFVFVYLMSCCAHESHIR